jgi:hypothetical protein
VVAMMLLIADKNVGVEGFLLPAFHLSRFCPIFSPKRD